MNLKVNDFIKRLKFLRNKPLLIKIIISNYIKIIFLRKKILRSVELHITNDCQCRCKKCLASKYKQKGKKELTIAQIRKIIAESYKLGAVNIGITGGEPLLNTKLYKILDAINTKRAIVNVTTNGILLTKENALKLKRHGVDSVFISIDTPVMNEHDADTGVKGSFKKAIDAIKNAKDAGLVVVINTVVSRDIFLNGKIWKLKKIVDENKVMWGIVYPCMAGRWSKSHKNILTSEHADILEKIKTLNNVRNDRSDNYLKYGCPAGTEKIFISIYGDVTPCSCIPLSFGNVKNNPLKDIYERMCNFPPFKKRSLVCNASENREFIEKYLKPIANHNINPINIEGLTNFPQNFKI